MLGCLLFPAHPRLLQPYTRKNHFVPQQAGFLLWASQRDCILLSSLFTCFLGISEQPVKGFSLSACMSAKGLNRIETSRFGTNGPPRSFLNLLGPEEFRTEGNWGSTAPACVRGALSARCRAPRQSGSPSSQSFKTLINSGEKETPIYLLAMEALSRIIYEKDGCYK